MIISHAFFNQPNLIENQKEMCRRRSFLSKYLWSNKQQIVGLEFRSERVFLLILHDNKKKVSSVKVLICLGILKTLQRPKKVIIYFDDHRGSHRGRTHRKDRNDAR